MPSSGLRHCLEKTRILQHAAVAINHQGEIALSRERVARAFMRAGFRVVRQGRRISMWHGETMITIPRNDPVDPWTPKGVLRDAGLTIEEFLDLV